MYIILVGQQCLKPVSKFNMHGDEIQWWQFATRSIDLLKIYVFEIKNFIKITVEYYSQDLSQCLLLNITYSHNLSR